MRRNRVRMALVGVVAAVILSSVCAGMAVAAVNGNLSAEYDASQSTDAAGREIVVSGTFSVTGRGAANPRIAIRPGPRTVLDASSVDVFVEGNRVVNFNQKYRPESVVYTAEEIPAGTTIEIRFVVYSKSTSQTNITAGSVNVQFASSAGSRQEQEFSATVDLTDSPGARVESLENQVSEFEEEIQSSPDWRQRFWIAVGTAAVVFVLGAALVYLRYVRDDGGGPPGSDGPGPGGPPPS